MGSFVERARYLEESVGDGNLVMGGIVGQAYSADVHNDVADKHTTGMAYYLAVPYTARRDEMIQKLANNAVTPEGSRLTDAAIEISNVFDEMVRLNAPVEKGILRDSTECYVTDNGVMLYNSKQRDGRVLGKYEGVPGPKE